MDLQAIVDALTVLNSQAVFEEKQEAVDVIRNEGKGLGYSEECGFYATGTYVSPWDGEELPPIPQGIER